MGSQIVALLAAWYTDPYAWLGFLKAAIGLGFVIFVHEMGHFLVAKACGVKCEKFYIGFDVPIKLGPLKLPASLWKKQWGETVYGIGIIPLGGYVKMLGQDDNPSKYREMQEKSRAQQEAGEEDAPVEDGEEDFVLDPRSYMAKSVPQRMAIISAGVIMNLIFAVIFATTAYSLGVPYEPAVIGRTTAGGPAWTANVQPGGLMTQLSEDGYESEHHRWDTDVLTKIAFSGLDDNIQITVTYPDKSVVVYDLPKEEYERVGIKMARIGVAAAQTNKLVVPKDDEDNVLNQLKYPGMDEKVAIETGDTIVALKIDGERVATPDYFVLQALFAQHVDKDITIVVNRVSKEEREKATKDGSNPKGEEIEFVVDRRPRRTLGLALNMAIVTAVQIDSPADGQIKIGDVLTKLNGQPIGDPLTLPDRLRRLAGTTIDLEVDRPGTDGKSESVSFSITPRVPAIYHRQDLEGTRVAVESLGIAYVMTNKVTTVEPSSAAAKAGLKSGDEIVLAEFIAKDEEATKLETDEKSLNLKKEFKLSDNNLLWPQVFARIQFSLPETEVKLTYLRDGKELEATLAPVASSDWSLPYRGLFFQPLEETHTAKDFGEAFSLGLRQTKEDAFRVFGFLRKLITGKIPPQALGGPGTIVAVASSEASRDITRLLMFLTLLSANLAVVNFLPIPVLDGGHMVFLILEGIFRRPVSEKIVIPLTYLGLFFILGLMIFVSGLDIDRFLL